MKNPGDLDRINHTTMARSRANKSRKLTPDHIPFEIIEIILSKSSPKPLLRFKSVSKSWNSLISDPVFIQNHHQKSISSNPHNLFLCNISNELSFVKLEDGKLQLLEEKPQGLPSGFTHFLCISEGVLLLGHHFSKNYVLWNPYTRAEKTIWSKFEGLRLTYGVCCDPAINDDFKVVIVWSSHYYVYCCKKGYWSNRKELHNYTVGCSLCSSGLSVNGAIYWSWLDMNNNTQGIIYFDPRDDMLKVLQKPKSVHNGKRLYLVDLSGSLCLYCYGNDETIIQLWTKEKGIDNNSWELLIVFRNVEIPISLFEPQCFVGDKIVIRDKYDGTLAVYSPLERDEFEQFEEGIKLRGLGLIPRALLPVKNTTGP